MSSCQVNYKPGYLVPGPSSHVGFASSLKGVVPNKWFSNTLENLMVMKSQSHKHSVLVC